LLTNKKFVYACNVNEDQMWETEENLKSLLWITNEETCVVPICAKLEEDMIDMSIEERTEFMEEMELTTTWLDDLIKASYDALWLEYYFTAWVQEVRAWTIHKWSTAPQAAGIIHTDFEKGFIKADRVHWSDLVEFGGWSQAKSEWKVGLEGKEYIVQDGDVLLFKFSN
jgi:ribosome-binding ATPase YchF (GTP1/OBG family)